MYAYTHTHTPHVVSRQQGLDARGHRALVQHCQLLLLAQHSPNRRVLHGSLLRSPPAGAHFVEECGALLGGVARQAALQEGHGARRVVGLAVDEAAALHRHDVLVGPPRFEVGCAVRYVAIRQHAQCTRGACAHAQTCLERQDARLPALRGEVILFAE